MVVAFLKSMSFFSLTVQLEIRLLMVLAKQSREHLFVMDNISLRQIIERFPELTYRYIGSFPADSVPRLPTFSFAIINTSPSTEAGEHWIMIARLNRTYYYADSLARPITKYKFLDKNYKKYQKMIQQPVQKTDNLCGFYTIIAAFQLFKIFQSKLNNVHDVRVLNFISNYK